MSPEQPYSATASVIQKLAHPEYRKSIVKRVKRAQKTKQYGTTHHHGDAGLFTPNSSWRIGPTVR
jgi:acyl-CoA hydrolase